ncbi:hypothetical protein BSZ31_15345 [Limnobacter sp. SAORIC-690]|uniref:GspE/PulE family protein n=1 Tax=Limnobacter sp. SAORIC-690 TaxID=1923970 RepID=UPI000CF566CF|nr:ATPase, T2SS/T4P/T4SS family [Limnobacter sp. SAORIC-690]PQJ26117.1 hypothetical protein BSZ31_15345 [Limnobacter sp. SAORIC-690]
MKRDPALNLLATQAEKSLKVEKLSELPAFSRVLTDGSAGALLKLPAAVEKYVCAIETGVKRAIILYDAEKLAQIRPFISHLRGKLIAEKFTFERPEIGCGGGVIEHLIENSRTKIDNPEGEEDPAVAQSKAKEIFESWVALAVQERATDIHVQVVNNIAEVKLRVDGELEFLRDQQGGVYTPLQAERAVAWAYNNASGKGSNSNSQFSVGENLYCMIAAREVGGKRVAMRYQSMRGWAGIKVVCRLLYVDIDAPTLSYEQLGYAPSHMKQLKSASNTPSGTIIFAGVTGSGKTTTLKTFIETHPGNGTDAFYSIEDPVEYPLRGVHQIPIQRDLLDRKGSAAKYAEVVAGLMRADPGCVLMGEIRDPATAISAQQIVETGHMACGTVHAHLISGIVPRLTNEEIGMSRDVLTNPNILTLLVYQALVPKLCPHCKIGGRLYQQGMPDSEHVLEILDTLENRYGLERDLFYFKKQGGCPKCKHRGTAGLSVVAEILTPDRKWLNLIRQGKDYEAMMYYRSKSDGNFKSENMDGKTVFEHTLFKALQGDVDPRHCERFDSFDRFEIMNDADRAETAAYT